MHVLCRVCNRPYDLTGTCFDLWPWWVQSSAPSLEVWSFWAGVWRRGPKLGSDPAGPPLHSGTGRQTGTAAMGRTPDKHLQVSKWQWRAVLLPQWDSRRSKLIPLRNNRWVVICCVLQFFGATSYRDISFLSYIKEQDEHPARGVQRKKKKLEKLEKLNSNVSFLKSDPITQDDPQTLLWAVSCRNHFLSKQPRRRKCASTHGQEAGWLS